MALWRAKDKPPVELVVANLEKLPEHLSLFEKSYRKLFQTRSRAPGSLLFLACSIPLEALGGTMVSAH